MKLLLFILFILIVSFSGKCQYIGTGADGMYNFQTEGFGAGARVSIFPDKKLSFAPQFSYYFPFNKVHEYYLGLALEYKIIRLKKFDFYLIGHGAYNSWLNYAASPMEGAQPVNWNLEGGAGVTTRKCLRPFLEYRYNIKFRETHLRLGFLYIFGCKGGNGKRRGGGGGKHELCPAYG